MLLWGLVRVAAVLGLVLLLIINCDGLVAIAGLLDLKWLLQVGFDDLGILLFQKIQTCTQNIQTCTYRSLYIIDLLQNIITIISINIMLFTAIRRHRLHLHRQHHPFRLLLLLHREHSATFLTHYLFAFKIALDILLSLLLFLQVIMLSLNELLNGLAIQIMVFTLKSSLFAFSRYLCSWFEGTILCLPFFFLFCEEFYFIVLMLLIFVPVVF